MCLVQLFCLPFSELSPHLHPALFNSFVLSAESSAAAEEEEEAEERKGKKERVGCGKRGEDRGAK